MTNTKPTFIEKALEKLNNSTITGHISGRHLILIGGKKDRKWDGGGYEENEYQYLDEWFEKKLAQAEQIGMEKVYKKVNNAVKSFGILTPEILSELKKEE